MLTAHIMLTAHTMLAQNLFADSPLRSLASIALSCSIPSQEDRQTVIEQNMEPGVWAEQIQRSIERKLAVSTGVWAL